MPVLPEEGLRPTGDRVRETIFNWLQQDISGTRVLDLFSGTGALGFEALSRGAAHVTFVESNPRLAKQLQNIADTWQVSKQVTVVTADAYRMLKAFNTSFDVLFCDPPFHSTDYDALFNLLTKTTCLDSVQNIYVEKPHALAWVLPDDAGWVVHRTLTYGAVDGMLLRRETS